MAKKKVVKKIKDAIKLKWYTHKATKLLMSGHVERRKKVR